MKKYYSEITQNHGDVDQFKFLEGATIYRVGITKDVYYDWDEDGKFKKSYLEGGLTFLIEKDGKKEKVILGYTELGAWLEHREDVGAIEFNDGLKVDHLDGLITKSERKEFFPKGGYKGKNT